MTKRQSHYLTAALLLVAAGFGCGGLQLTLKNTSVQKPSNVALYFSVEDHNGVGQPNLAVEAFKIYEDDHLISPFESKQTILNPENDVIRYTLLLVDLSGSITESNTMPAVTTAASGFADKVTKTHQIGIYGFDGGKRLIPIAGFSSSAGSVQGSLNALQNRKGRDPSTNLNGAVVESLAVLDKQLAHAKQPIKFGTLVIFTDGTDRAHRVSEEDMYQAINESHMNIFVIGLGPELTEGQGGKIGRNGFVRAEEQGKVAAAFDEVAARMDAAAKKFYLLSYCSPSRAGTHVLRVEVTAQAGSGSLAQEFSAEGFGPNCNPNARPNFPIGKIVAK